MGATGLESSTSGLRSSSAERRLTNVVLASRMKPGRRWSDWPRATRWLARAWVVVDRWETRPLRSELRVATSETSLPVLVMKLVKSPVLRFSSRNSALEAATAGLRYWKAACIF